MLKEKPKTKIKTRTETEQGFLFAGLEKCFLLRVVLGPHGANIQLY